jgi:hypothetical protein
MRQLANDWHTASANLSLRLMEEGAGGLDGVHDRLRHLHTCHKELNQGPPCQTIQTHDYYAKRFTLTNEA